MTSFTTLYASLTGFRLLVKANRIGCDSDFARNVHDKLITYLEEAIGKVQKIIAAERQALKNNDEALSADYDECIFYRTKLFTVAFRERYSFPLVDHLDFDDTTNECYINGRWIFTGGFPDTWVKDVTDDRLCGLRGILDAIWKEAKIYFTAYELVD